MVNYKVFLLVGLEEEIDLLLDKKVAVLVAIATILIARAIVVYGLRLIINRRGIALPWKWALVAF